MRSTPGKQATRQAARRAAAEAQATLMRGGLERDRRCAALGVQVVAALRERDDLVQRYERQAGEALRALVVDEAAVGAAEAVQWCAGAVTTPDVARLRRLAEAIPDDGAGGPPVGRGDDASTSDGADFGHPHVNPVTVRAARREARWPTWWASSWRSDLSTTSSCPPFTCSSASGWAEQSPTPTSPPMPGSHCRATWWAACCS